MTYDMGIMEILQSKRNDRKDKSMESMKKMDYTEFKETLKKLVQERADADVEVKIILTVNNNQTKSEV